jgi:hypothetical protein
MPAGFGSEQDEHLESPSVLREGESHPASERVPFEKPGRSILPWSRSDFFACLGCMMLGLFLAIEPHLAKLASEGTLEYLPDGDDILYLSISRHPFHGETGLRDPFSTADRKVPTLYSWLQFVPLAKAARLVGLSTISTSFLWRLVGGPLFGGSLYILFRKLLGGTRRPTAWAVGCTLICLADGGFAGVPPLIRDFRELLFEMIRPSRPLTAANQIGQYRVVTPLLNLPWLLLLIAVLLPGGRKDRTAWALGSICFGLCIHLYFFFWTAAIVGIVGYLTTRALTLLVRRSSIGGWQDIRFGAAVVAGGMVLGAPQIYSNLRLSADPEYKPMLQRMQRGSQLEPGDPHRTLYLKNKWPIAELAVGGGIIAGLGLWNLGLVWWMVLAGYALSASAFVTGLEFENFHWAYVWAPMGEIMLLALAASILDRLRPGRWQFALWVFPITLVLIALVWRPFEALHQRHSVVQGRILRELDPLRPTLADLSPYETLAGPPEANTALLMTRAGLLYQYDQSWVSSLLPASEVNERFALNAWLLGMDMPRFRDAIVEREPVRERGMGPEWIKTFQVVLDGKADDLMARHKVGALLLPADAPPPIRGGPWRRDAAGDRWILWRRDPGQGSR